MPGQSNPTVRTPQEQMRNFCIIAHIDHGKSTLADRLLEVTGTVDPREMREQVLDRMELERERGITIKMQAVRMLWEEGGKTYELNLIDTPGHVDFSYEVSRSLKACEGALLVVDAAQGVEAQTIANLYLAVEEGLEIIPVINKIDLPTADIPGVTEQLTQLIGCREEEIVKVSAKTGEGVEELIAAIISRIPPPQGDPDRPLRALVFDSHYDNYFGVVTYVRIFEGTVRKGEEVLLMGSGARAKVDRVGIFTPELTDQTELRAGEVGFVMTGIKEVRLARVGDTLTHLKRPATEPLPGYRPAKPMVFSGLYPVNSEQYEELKSALERLSLNDAALHFEQESSDALGFGFRCGFLGLLHMEIVQERIEREYGIELVATSPSVVYRVRLTDGSELEIDSPAKLPDRAKIDQILEPIVEASVLTPVSYMSPMIELIQRHRGSLGEIEYLPGKRVNIHARLPLAEILLDFYDQLKTLSRGMASFDYQLAGYEPADLVRVDILVNREPVDSLSFLCHRQDAQRRGRAVIQTLRKVIPRQLFEVALQAAVGGKVIARENIPPLRKDVTAKCYGGDITRKRKLLERQKEGKKRMKMVGRVEIPQEAFLAVLRKGPEEKRKKR